ncbi:hypothetical protein [Emticicia agri]|uniref:Serine protease n=1 Tax=Emticicia agri TaxID=2492393 RepID=A0A4Q5LU70_9BACT|nr:hypothetical protein [Emticicia agri]RYU93201.1 hypothetical protein EWM59_23285 [Emticicia agri]
MKRFVFLLSGFLLLSFTLVAQINPLMLKNLIRVKSVVVDDKGKEYAVFGGGFIVNSKYLATTYSIYRPAGFTKKPKRVVAYYNFRIDDKKALKADSIDIDLLYKYTPQQYDFSKHVFKEGRLETDFIVLKLKRVIPVKANSFNTEANLPKYTRLNTIAFDNVSGKLRNDTLIYLFPQFFNNVKESYQLVIYGPSKIGFSGTPIFNTNNEIVSVVQYGLSEINEEYVDELTKAGWLTEEDALGIRRGYASFDPQNFIFATNIKYFLDTYLKGFK